ncbi:hypothetical protein KO525_06515 [Psychrosphaera sp. B3R10]|uniref:hypothetical protein n=1 Tax=unclassified Psychrosphaera TaxID=2641570 RepID=UPI001C081339|nr:MULTISPECIES: hypothetical protein [unclassified Psychrosphaera]MBU2882349.1 hypothetical protein [Psychrosphaera sp. I2R16]MBU2989030.1 hypothetical protein [Psychrosphaera sp. B3R10]
MEIFKAIGITNELIQYFITGLLFFMGAMVMYKMVLWGKKMPRGAFLFLALFPLITIFPIPPPIFKTC